MIAAIALAQIGPGIGVSPARSRLVGTAGRAPAANFAAKGLAIVANLIAGGISCVGVIAKVSAVIGLSLNRGACSHGKGQSSQ